MARLNLMQWFFIIVLITCILGMIYNDATTDYVDVWLVDTSFSFSNMRPFSWLISLFVWINVFYPFIRSAGLKTYDLWQGCYPVTINWKSRFLGILAALYNVVVFCVIIICTLLCPLKESDLRDFPLTQILTQLQRLTSHNHL